MSYECAKRPLDDDDPMNSGRFQKMMKKHPVAEINERYPNIKYTFEQEGASHIPVFKATAVIDGQTFEGIGGSKQKAKLTLATRALEVLGTTVVTAPDSYIPPPPPSAVIQTDVSSTIHSVDHIYDSFYYQPLTGLKEESKGFFQDFALDAMPGRDRDRPLYAPPRFRAPLPHPWIQQQTPKVEKPDIQHVKQSHIVGPFLPPEAVAQGFSQLFTNRPEINVEKARSYPVMVLCEVFPDMQINWCEGVGRGDRQFKVEAEVQGRRFFGEGRSKKLAKLNLAKTILLCMYDIHDFKDAEASNKTPKAKSDEIQLEKKFPLTQLKELVGENLTIDVAQQNNDDDVDDKIFVATIVINEVKYEAVGKNRNLAKLRAAKKALDVIRPKKNLSSEDLNGNGLTKMIDTTRHPTMVFYELYRDVKFTESESKTSNGLTEYHMMAEVEGEAFQAKASSKKKAKLRLVLQAFEKLRDIGIENWTSVDMKEVLEDKQLSSNPAANHPIVLLLKLNPQTRFEVKEDFESDTTTPKYKATACVGEREFTGEGPNKKSAKTIAARQALNVLYGIDPDNYVEENRIDYFADTEPKHELDSELCNLIADAVQLKFTEVFQGETQCKVVAAFLLSQHNDEMDIPMLNVVSLGTGTKCITGDQIDHKGQTLNDSHGEIIACRGFRQFLFDQLSYKLSGNNNGDMLDIFEETSSQKYALKSSISVYLYVNTAPCGDGRVFTLQTQQQGAKNKTAGLLRTKIENGQGTIPVPENNIQTSDGLLEGERLRTMSCSDKILKWNALGVQGALLSYFLEPIYLHGIVISLHYHYDALYRALHKRAGKMVDCPEPYHLNKPGLGTPDRHDASRDTSKATSNSFNWYYEQKNVEAVNATTGKTVVLSPSRLCKLNFFDKFMQVLKQSKLHDVCPTTYHSAKMLAVDYNKAKDAFFTALDDTTCGKWIGKPYEHDMFGY